MTSFTSNFSLLLNAQRYDETITLMTDIKMTSTKRVIPTGSILVIQNAQAIEMNATNKQGKKTTLMKKDNFKSKCLLIKISLSIKAKKDRDMATTTVISYPKPILN